MREWIVSIASVVMLLVVSSQAIMMYKFFNAEQERRIKENTIQTSLQMFERFREKDRRLFKMHNNKKINLNKYDEETTILVTDLLSDMEIFSGAVNMGVYNFDIVKRIMGDYVVQKRSQYSDFITDCRKGNKMCMHELKRLANQIESQGYQSSKDTSGDIQ